MPSSSTSTGSKVGDPDECPVEEPLPGHFDLDTSILLAGFAFESYLSPEGGLLDTDVHGGSTAYFSDFVRDVFAGVLEVTVTKGENLPKGDALGQSDPYCILSTGGGSSFRTATKRMTLNPKWKPEEATARLYVRRATAQQVLTIRVLDEDILESDDLLGVVTVPLSGLVKKAENPLGQMFAPTEEKTLGLPAGHGAPGGGAITFKMKYLPFNPPAVKVVTKGLRKAAKTIDASGQGKDLDFKAKLAVRAAGLAAGAIAEGLDFVSKEASRRESESALWAVKPDGEWALLAKESKLQVRGRDATPNAFEKVCFVENTKTDTQAAVWCNGPERTIVVSFRGTEMNKIKDVITDTNLVPSSFNPERVFDGGSAADPEGIGGVEEDSQVHSGFLAAYDSVRGRVFSALDDIMAHAGESFGSFDESAEVEDKQWHVFVTGHSLGGALATLFSAELGGSIQSGKRGCTVSMYNYGSPRVGNRAFCESFNKLVPDSIRIINGTDLVPTLPALLGYRHVDHGVRIPKDGSGALCGAKDVRRNIVPDRENEQTAMGKGGDGATKILELADALGVGTALGVDEETAADAAAALASLVSSDALLDHFEDKYYVALKDAAGKKT